MKLKQLLMAIFFVIPMMHYAQLSNKAPDDWHHLDFGKDGYNGISTEKMYEALKDKKSETVIVAVIDSGVDAGHEDLKEVMWVNTDEIPGNGVDDDNNGYADDVNGWNFIGGKDGNNVHYDQLELTRLYVDLHKVFKDKDPSVLSRKEKKEYEKYKKLEKELEKKREETSANVIFYGGLLEAVESLIKELGKENITREGLENFELEDPLLTKAAVILSNALGSGVTIDGFMKQLSGGVKYYSSQFDYYYNPDFNPRPIVGDNYRNSNERIYGNNDVVGPDAGHGTHVAGIIAAKRNNGLGVNGVADNVRIMSVRTVPEGDERDKDVANAIIYAVDNGASVINMSFGKGYAYDKKVVDKAVKYAKKKDVLLIHAAGNSSQNNDTNDNFPNDIYEKRGLFKSKKAKNWLEVGALSWKQGEYLPARFSNYGKENVDVFSPGKDIYSTTPNNNYEHFDGTSMASPVVAGLAAIIRGYYPDLTAKQVKEVIMSSVEKQNITVKVPGSNEKVLFSELCQTGGVVNGYKAVKLAEQTKGKKKDKNKKNTLSGSRDKKVKKKPGRV